MSRGAASTWSPPPADGGAPFALTPANAERLEAAAAAYPADRRASAVLWGLWIAQEQNGGWLSGSAIEHIAGRLGMAPMRVHEVARFYTMFNLRDKGPARVQVCRTTPCWIAGSDAVLRACLEAAGAPAPGAPAPDGRVLVEEVECLGACCNAPAMQLNDGPYYEDLTPARAAEIVRALRADPSSPPPGGSQSGRRASEPAAPRAPRASAAAPAAAADPAGEGA